MRRIFIQGRRGKGIVALALCMASVATLHCDGGGSGTSSGNATSVSASGVGGDAPTSSSSGEGGAGGVGGVGGSGGSGGAGGGPILDGKAHVLETYVLAPTSLQILNPFLSASDLEEASQNGAMTLNAPGIGSGIARYGGPLLAFAMITDRGLIGDHYDASNTVDGKVFPLPKFTPTIALVHLGDGVIVLDQALPLVDGGGNPITAISNTANDDTPFLNVASMMPLPYNESGMDTEDVAPLPGGRFLVTDEYSPSVAVIGSGGEVLVRYTPSGVKLPSAAYPVSDILPPVLTDRRKNRGLEGVALSADSKTAFAVLQSPMGSTKDARYADSRVVRLLRLDMTDPLKASVTGHFLLLQSDKADYPAGNTQRDISYSAVQPLDEGKVVLLERGKGMVKLFVADLSDATNLVGNTSENTLDPEDIQTAGKGYAALGLMPATLTQVFTSEDTPEIIGGAGGLPGTAFIEGFAILDSSTVALANDNDFGMTDPKDVSRVWIVQLGQALP